MSSNPSKINTFNIKKDSKRQAKKRKLEAFLDLVRKDELTPIPGKKKLNTFEESYKALKQELQKYQKKQDKEPSLSLKDDGRCAIVSLSSSGKIPNSGSPLFVEDLCDLLLTSVLGNLSPFPPRWVKIVHAQNISKTVFIEIEGLSQKDVIEIHSKLSQDSFMFPFTVEIVSLDAPFSFNICTSHINTGLYDSGNKGYCMFPVDCNLKKSTNIKSDYKISKLHLLLSPIQLAMEHYPLPQSVFEQSKSEGYCFTKDSYAPVSENSPMFAVDCEMCRTVTGRQEVTRIAIINENLETVYHTLVKPKDEIIDYVTRFSGVTEGMLKDVTTTLDDVQRDMQKILPSDAILCGQSLNCDLHGLRMIHPYVIDTSVIFNEHGIRYKKTSLKKLAKIHLKETIQDDKRGHSPIQDAIATMKLVQLKLNNSVEYGDFVLCSDTSDTNKNTGNTPDESADSVYPCRTDETFNISDYITSNPDYKTKSFFGRLSRFSKKTCLIGSETCLNNYCAELITENVKKEIEPKVKKIIKAISENIEDHDLVLSHLSMATEDSLTVSELGEEIKKIYDAAPNNTSFIILMSGVNKYPEGKFKHNFCTVNIKNKTNSEITV